MYLDLLLTWTLWSGNHPQTRLRSQTIQLIQPCKAPRCYLGRSHPSCLLQPNFSLIPIHPLSRLLFKLWRRRRRWWRQERCPLSSLHRRASERVSLASGSHHGKCYSQVRELRLPFQTNKSSHSVGSKEGFMNEVQSPTRRHSEVAWLTYATADKFTHHGKIFFTVLCFHSTELISVCSRCS